jgi:hypothetical protein
MTDYRSLLERDLDLVGSARFTFDDLARRRDRKRRGQRLSAMAAALVIVAVGVAALIWTWGPEGPVPADRPADPFVGTWESVDLDGSSQRMTIRGPEEGIYQIEVVDDMSTACGGTPATASGTGTLAAGTRMTISQTYTCEDGTVLREVEGIRLEDWSLVYDPATDTLADPTDVVWHREGAERIPIPIPDGATSQTVETSLGTWTWTWVPEEEGASRLWNQALQQLDPENDFSVSARLPQDPGPRIAGMTWSEWWEERVARSSDVTVAGVSRNGEIDWSAVYDLDVWAVPRHEGPTTVEIHEGFLGPLVAVLEVRLVPGNPEAVEFHDVDTGEVVLRLEATDPAVSAEQLGRLVHWSLLIDEGDGFREVLPPWEGLPIDWVDVAAWNDGFVAVGAGPADWPGGDQTPLLYRWASPDGSRWNATAPPLPLPLQTKVETLELLGDEARLFLKLAGEEDPPSLWTSTDGVEWHRVGVDVGTGGFIHVWRTGFGWALTNMDRRCSVWLSPDGVAWEPVPRELELMDRPEVEAVQCSVIGDDVYAMLEEMPPDEGPARPLGLLIGSLDG